MINTAYSRNKTPLRWLVLQLEARNDRPDTSVKLNALHPHFLVAFLNVV
jgi:hypothetical protein